LGKAGLGNLGAVHEHVIIAADDGQKHEPKNEPGVLYPGRWPGCWISHVERKLWWVD
jgi:hypothetical protein